MMYGFKKNIHLKGFLRSTLSKVKMAASCSPRLALPPGTHAKITPLLKDSKGEPANPNINNASVVGMLLYLSGHTQPDIAFTVHHPTKQHMTVLKHICQYLKATRDKGLIMKPSNHIHVDCHADFASLYNAPDA
ncbi:hypothetical protein ACHAW6_007224 [Cyclotella cf. meneghiniana]